MSTNKAVTKILRVVVSAALLIWLAWRTDWHQVGQVFRHLRLELWLSAVGLFLLAQVVSAVRWRLLAQPLGFQAPLRDFLRFYFVGMFFNLLLPTSVGGDVVRAWYLDGRSGRRLAAFLSVFVDRFSGLLVLLTLACLADILCPIALPLWIEASLWATAGCAVMGLLSIPALARRLAVWSMEQGASSAQTDGVVRWHDGPLHACQHASAPRRRDFPRPDCSAPQYDGALVTGSRGEHRSRLADRAGHWRTGSGELLRHRGAHGYSVDAAARQPQRHGGSRRRHGAVLGAAGHPSGHRPDPGFPVVLCVRGRQCVWRRHLSLRQSISTPHPTLSPSRRGRG